MQATVDGERSSFFHTHSLSGPQISCRTKKPKAEKFGHEHTIGMAFPDGRGNNMLPAQQIAQRRACVEMKSENIKMEMMFHTTLRCGKLDGKLNGYSALINNIKNTNENELNRKTL